MVTKHQRTQFEATEKRYQELWSAWEAQRQRLVRIDKPGRVNLAEERDRLKLFRHRVDEAAAELQRLERETGLTSEHLAINRDTEQQLTAAGEL